ncbi:PilT protein domain protein [Desulfamplus magnetovallimortis]|uniref:PilT protein domain protein n=1 Tax=Desulfamplus magnetovallimortis TaxID=1246637 RepID=A0A1W1HA34_9BACT|nr:PIN domain-containing protein [Desulfamplus magnetovallimortis]SLM29354.1 PilT protein domain protein [Desulfamplus magnetovallimortis]
MTLLFLDTDIIMDVFAERDPFYDAAAALLTIIENKQVFGCTSSLIFSNLYYVLRRLRDKTIAIRSLKKLYGLLHILPVEKKNIEFALQSDFTDFEDAIQYHTAVQNGVTHLITRNIKDYKAADRSIVTICTADDYIKIRDASQNT